MEDYINYIELPNSFVNNPTKPNQRLRKNVWADLDRLKGVFLWSLINLYSMGGHFRFHIVFPMRGDNINTNKEFIRAKKKHVTSLLDAEKSICSKCKEKEEMRCDSCYHDFRKRQLEKKIGHLKELISA